MSGVGTEYETDDSEFGQTLVDELVQLLDLEPIDEDIFRGRSPESPQQRVFGGQVAGQALVAAGRTVEPGRLVHSLHSYFIRPGDPRVPIIYTVDRVRDGRSFTTRRVVASQHGKAIFSLSASFQLEQGGISHQDEAPETPGPEGRPVIRARPFPFPFDLRYVDLPSWQQREAGPRSGPHRIWMKATGTLPDDPLVHACALTFAADLSQLDTVLVRHGLSEREDQLRMASLDHAVWFHRPFRADEWLLYVLESPTASGSRGFTQSRIYDAKGEQIASVAQEGMFRRASG